MPMITDDERREVARRLREVQAYVIPGAKTEVHPITGRIIGVACGYELPDFQGLLGRLADLIEPGEPKVRCVAEVKVDGERLERLAHDAAVELTGIDRDALLALAGCVKKMGEDYDKTGSYGLGLTFRAIADRIREALRVLEASDDGE